MTANHKKPTIQRTARQLLRRVGYDVQRFVSTDFASRPVERRMQLLEHFNINLIFDIGANIGQYATDLRRMGYQRRIVSFEPLTDAYRSLRERARSDESWETVHCALGDYDGITEINIAANSQSSSLLNMMPAHSGAAPDSAYIGKEDVVVSRLDTILEAFKDENEKLFVKIDAQGFESKIIDGASEVLHLIDGFQVEASLVQLYEGEALIDETIVSMRNRGYTLVSIEPGFSDAQTGMMLQADLIFFRIPSSTLQAA